jgi:hypothetical protein
MSTTALADALVFSITAAGLWILFFWRYRDYRVDRFRQHIFVLRDELFDYAAAGGIAFDHPSYAFVRRNLNGMLRFGHHLTLSWLLARAITDTIRPVPELMQEFVRERYHRLESLDGERKRVLNNIWMRAHIRAVEHIVLSSPFFWVAVVPVLLVLFMALCWRAGGYFIVRHVPGLDLLDKEAASLGAGAGTVAAA